MRSRLVLKDQIERYRQTVRGLTRQRDQAVAERDRHLRDYNEVAERLEKAQAALNKYRASLALNKYRAGLALNKYRAGLDTALARVARLERAVAAVEHLIDNSSGVTGLHLNGDDASWESLRTGGMFETWLLDFDAALAAAKEGNDDAS